MKKYTIYFSGQALEGFSTAQVKQNLAKLFKLDDEKVARLFTNKAVIIKKNLDIDKAKQYQGALLKAGAKIHVKQSTETQGSNTEPPPAQTPKVSQKPEPKNVTDTSASTGSNTLSAGLAGLTNYNQHAKATTTDLNPTQTTQQPASASPSSTFESSTPTSTVQQQNEAVADASTGITLSAPNTGSLEEYMPLVEAVDIPDISELSMSEANAGSFEPLAKSQPIPEIPDTSYMDITDKNNRPLSDQTPKSKPADIPDISELSMSEAKSGDLTEFNQEKPPADIPDISQMSMDSAP